MLLSLLITAIAVETAAQSEERALKVYRALRSQAVASDAVRPRLTSSGVRYGKEGILCKFVLGGLGAVGKPLVDTRIGRPSSEFATAVNGADFSYNLTSSSGSHVLRLASTTALAHFTQGQLDISSRIPERPLGLSIRAVEPIDMLSLRGRYNTESDVTRAISSEGIASVKIRRPAKASMVRRPEPIAIRWSDRLTVDTFGLLERELFRSYTGLQTFESQLVLKFVEDAPGRYATKVQSLTGLFPSFFRRGSSFQLGSNEIKDGRTSVKNFIPEVPPFMVEVYASGNKNFLVFEFTTIADGKGRLPAERFYSDSLEYVVGRETVRKALYNTRINTETIQHIEFDTQIELANRSSAPILRIHIFTNDSAIEVRLPVDFAQPKESVDLNYIFEHPTREQVLIPRFTTEADMAVAPFDYVFPGLQVRD